MVETQDLSNHRKLVAKYKLHLAEELRRAANGGSAIDPERLSLANNFIAELEAWELECEQEPSGLLASIRIWLVLLVWCITLAVTAGFVVYSGVQW